MEAHVADLLGRGSDARQETVVLIGAWNGLPAQQASVQVGSIRIERCPAQVRSIRELMRRRHASWLLIGDAPDESTLASLVRPSLHLYPTLRLAMLGPPTDWKRCERWLRRGCSVYLSNSSGLERCIAALALSKAHQVVVLDKTFQELAAAEARRIELGGSLTSREEQVLTLVCLGLRNCDIASILHLSESTIEFHVHHILDKLGARTRVEAVCRAIALGLEPKAVKLHARENPGKKTNASLVARLSPGSNDDCLRRG